MIKIYNKETRELVFEGNDKEATKFLGRPRLIRYFRTGHIKYVPKALPYIIKIDDKTYINRIILGKQTPKLNEYFKVNGYTFFVKDTKIENGNTIYTIVKFDTVKQLVKEDKFTFKGIKVKYNTFYRRIQRNLK